MLTDTDQLTGAAEPVSAPPSAPPASLTPTTMTRLMGRYRGPVDVDGKARAAGLYADAREAIPAIYRKSPGDCFAVIGHAQDLDIGVSVAFANLYFTNGRAGMSGQLMLALIMRAGHRVIVLEHNETIARMRFIRGDGQPGGDVTWKFVEAQRAGLHTKESWRSYPLDMLFWRCVARGARRFMSDVVLGFGYVLEELQDFVPDEMADLADPQVLPTVAPDVWKIVEPLVDVDEHGQVTPREGLARDPDLIAAWKLGTKRGLLNTYAGTAGGIAYTLIELLTHLQGVVAWRAEQAQQKPASDQGNDADQGIGDGSTSDPDEAEPVQQPKVLRCDCPDDMVMLTGDHLEACPMRIDKVTL